jgi:hypothetical protein
VDIDFDGLSPIQAARRAGLPRVVERLLALGANEPATPVQRPARPGWFNRWLGRSRA